MDLSLSEEQEAFRALARDFLEKEAVPHRQQWDRDESVDLAIIPKMAEIGFFGLTIPEEYGGLGGDYVTYVLGMEELGRADSALRGIVSVSNGLVGKSILGFGTEEQKQEWLPGIATAEKLGCFGLTEPGTGSDAGNLTTQGDARTATATSSTARSCSSPTAPGPTWRWSSRARRTTARAA